jgi:hypothetical protein
MWPIPTGVGRGGATQPTEYERVSRMRRGIRDNGLLPHNPKVVGSNPSSATFTSRTEGAHVGCLSLFLERQSWQVGVAVNRVAFGSSDVKLLTVTCVSTSPLTVLCVSPAIRSTSVPFLSKNT